MTVDAGDLLDMAIPGGGVTEAGVRQDVSVGLRYLDAWLRGNGAAAIDNLMEDAATAEISRSQLWQWRRHGTRLDDGRPVSAELYEAIRDEELSRNGGRGVGRLGDAVDLLDRAGPDGRLRRVPDPRRLSPAGPPLSGARRRADRRTRGLDQGFELALYETTVAPPADERAVADHERPADDGRADRPLSSKPSYGV